MCISCGTGHFTFPNLVNQPDCYLPHDFSSKQIFSATKPFFLTSQPCFCYIFNNKQPNIITAFQTGFKTIQHTDYQLIIVEYLILTLLKFTQHIVFVRFTTISI
jgi:hypothetical protein